MKRMLLIFLGVLLFTTGCQRGHEFEEVERPRVTGVTARVINTSVVSEYYEASGTVRAETVSHISSRVMGTVTSVKVEEGDRVRRGQVLLTIDDRDIAEKVKAAEEAYEEARRALGAAQEQKELAAKTYQRYKMLFERQALTGQELDTVETKLRVAEHEFERMRAMVKRAKAGLGEARVSLGYAVVRSPLNGIVTDKLTETGSMAAPGMPLLTVEDDSRYRIEVDVDERYLRVIKRGAKADVYIASVDRYLEGEIAEVVPRVKPETRTFRVKLDIPDGMLRTGLYGKLRFTVGTRQALVVPARAVVSKGQLTGVYTVDGGGVITYRLVRAGRDYEGSVEILSGLEAGERVITEGVQNARDGGILVEAAGDE